jgi:hypothetical protein
MTGSCDRGYVLAEAADVVTGAYSHGGDAAGGGRLDGELCRQLCRWLAKTPPTVNNCHRAVCRNDPWIAIRADLAPPNGLRVIDQPYDPVGIVANQVRKHQRGGYEARRARGRTEGVEEIRGNTDEFVLPEPGSFHGARQIGRSSACHGPDMDQSLRTRLLAGCPP